jgi:hypothetical protein
MASILFLYKDAVITSAEQEVVNVLLGGSNTVATMQAIGFVTGDDAPYDVLWASGRLNSGSTAAALLEAPTPIIMNYSSDNVTSSFEMAGSGGGTWLDEEAVNADDSNPINSGLPSGTFAFFNTDQTIRNITQRAASGVIALRSTRTPMATYVPSYYIPQGDALFDGVTPSPNLRILAFSYSSADDFLESDLTANGVQHYLSLVDFAAPAVSTPKIEGTLTPWETGVPAANVTGIQLIVRADITTDAAIILDTTFATDASGQFSVESALLPAATAVDCVFIKDAKKKFHTITTS